MVNIVLYQTALSVLKTINCFINIIVTIYCYHNILIKLMLSLITYYFYSLFLTLIVLVPGLPLSPLLLPLVTFPGLSLLLPFHPCCLLFNLSLLPPPLMLSSPSSLLLLFMLLFLLFSLHCQLSFMSLFLFCFSLSSLNHILLSKLLPLSKQYPLSSLSLLLSLSSSALFPNLRLFFNVHLAITECKVFMEFFATVISFPYLFNQVSNPP